MGPPNIRIKGRMAKVNGALPNDGKVVAADER